MRTVDVKEAIFLEGIDLFVNGWYLDRFYKSEGFKDSSFNSDSLREKCSITTEDKVYSKGLLLW